MHAFMYKRDIHILRYFSSFVSVSQGQVINITEPKLIFCPLASHLYEGFRVVSGNDKQAVKDAIKKVIELKIRDYGFFTDNRKLLSNDAVIPFGASEMVSMALKKKAIEAAVLVCDGAGTVVVNDPEVSQGIGARMNSLLLTSPIKGVIERLKSFGCRIVFENALINQVGGVKDALKAGYKNIVVTVCGHSAEDLEKLRFLEKENGLNLIILALCTTGISEDEINMIRAYADLAWSCASSGVRRVIGPLSILQLSRQIPVFVLTKKGLDFVSAYARQERLIRGLDIDKQYLVSNDSGGQSVHFGRFNAYIAEFNLPAGSQKEPVFRGEKRILSV